MSIVEPDSEAQKFQVPPQVNADQAVLSLMAMAENFRIAKVAKHKMAIKCVLAALKIQCSTELCALCNYELGKLLWLYTRNIKLAIFHLKKAYNIMKDLGQPLELACLKVVCLISEIYIGERYYEEIKGLLKNEVTVSAKYPIMHAKLLFLFGEVYLKLRDYDKSLEVVNTGIVYFRKVNEIVVECYFRLAKSLILSIQLSNQQELGNSVSELGEILQNVSNSVSAINDIRAFCYSIQLCYFLSTGMLKSSKQCLRQLHMTVQASENQPVDTNPHFRWLSGQMLTGLAYVLTVLANIQYSNFDRAHRYYAIALQHFERLKGLMRMSLWPVVERCEEEFISQLELLLYESTAQTHLILGNPQESLSNICSMIKIVRNSTTFLQDFEPQIHTLLGFYAYYMRIPEHAEKQFKVALKTTTDTELWTMINLSLAILYMFESRDADFYELFEFVSPLKLKSVASSLKSAAHFVHALYYYLHLRTDDSRSHLMGSITISKEEDMARLQAMALLLLSKSFKCRDADMLNAACEWATKSHDGSLLMWAHSQILQLHLDNGQTQDASVINSTIVANKERIENNRRSCKQLQHHDLIEWIDEAVDSLAID